MAAQIWIMTFWVNRFLKSVDDQTYVASFDDAQIRLPKFRLCRIRLPLVKCSGKVGSIEKQEAFRDIESESKLLAMVSDMQ
jgi:hypothetical protein